MPNRIAIILPLLQLDDPTLPLAAMLLDRSKQRAPHVPIEVIAVSPEPDEGLATMLNRAIRAAAAADYLVFLQPRTLVTADWVQVAGEVAAARTGWRCRQLDVAAPQVDETKPFQLGVKIEPLHAIPVSTVGGSCWGAPREAILRAGGFDLAYDREASGHAPELAVRLARLGLMFQTTARASAIHLRRVTAAGHNTTRHDTHTVKRLHQQLAKDRTRILPAIPFDFSSPVAAPDRGPAAGAAADADPARAGTGHDVRPAAPAVGGLTAFTFLDPKPRGTSPPVPLPTELPKPPVPPPAGIAAAAPALLELDDLSPIEESDDLDTTDPVLPLE